jgi:hypothetical protein
MRYGMSDAGPGCVETQSTLAAANCLYKLVPPTWEFFGQFAFASHETA